MNKSKTTLFPELPDGWFIERLAAEKIRVLIEDYECELVHPERLCSLSGELSKVYGSGNTPIDAILNAVRKIP